MNVFSTNKQRKYLIAIGSPSCTAMGFPILDRVKTDIQRVEKLLINEEQGYERVLADGIYISATSSQIKNELTTWFASSARHNSDCVIIYYAGHAEEKDNSHYLYTVDSNRSNLPNTVIETSDLVKLLFPGKPNSPQNILLILDVCYAGQGAANVLVESLTKNRKASENISFYVIASADSRTEAGDGDFVEAFEKVMKDSDWMKSKGEFLNPTDLVGHINKKVKADNKVIQEANCSILKTLGDIRFFLNPHFLSPKNLKLDEQNLNKNLKETKCSEQKIADILCLLDYSDQQQAVKSALDDCKEKAFIVQTNEENIQFWLVRRLAECVLDFDKAKKYEIRISRHPMRHNFDAFWEEFQQDIGHELNRETVIQGLATLCQQKSIIIAIYNLSSLEAKKVEQFHDFWLELVRQVRCKKRYYWSHLVLIIAERNDDSVLNKLHHFNCLDEANETQDYIFLSPLKRIKQNDIRNWIKEKDVHNLLTSLKLTDDELQSIVDKLIPNLSEEPFKIIDEICYEVFKLKNGITDIEPYWKLAG